MTTDDARLAQAIEAFIQHLETGSPEPDLSDLPADLRAEAKARMQLLSAMDGALSGAPEPRLSRAAAALGFDRPDQDIVISGSLLKRQRMDSRRNVGEIADMVRSMGVALTNARLMHLEMAPATPLPQPLVSALAAALDTDVSEIEASADAQVSALRAFLDSPRVADIISTWAAEHDRETQGVAEDVRRQLTGANFRAEDVTFDQLLELLTAILRRMER
jgi:hypothetical protein